MKEIDENDILKMHKENDWEDEFDKEFPPVDGSPMFWSPMKKFIRQLLSSQAEEIRRKVERIKYANHDPKIGCICDTCLICNRILDDILSIIKNKQK